MYKPRRRFVELGMGTLEENVRVSYAPIVSAVSANDVGTEFERRYDAFESIIAQRARDERTGELRAALLTNAVLDDIGTFVATSEDTGLIAEFSSWFATPPVINYTNLGRALVDTGDGIPLRAVPLLAARLLELAHVPNTETLVQILTTATSLQTFLTIFVRTLREPTADARVRALLIAYMLAVVPDVPDVPYTNNPRSAIAFFAIAYELDELAMAAIRAGAHLEPMSELRTPFRAFGMPFDDNNDAIFMHVDDIDDDDARRAYVDWNNVDPETPAIEFSRYNVNRDEARTFTLDRPSYATDEEEARAELRLRNSLFLRAAFREQHVVALILSSEESLLVFRDALAQYFDAPVRIEETAEEALYALSANDDAYDVLESLGGRDEVAPWVVRYLIGEEDDTGDIISDDDDDADDDGQHSSKRIRTKARIHTGVDTVISEGAVDWAKRKAIQLRIGLLKKKLAKMAADSPDRSKVLAQIAELQAQLLSAKSSSAIITNDVYTPRYAVTRLLFILTQGKRGRESDSESIGSDDEEDDIDSYIDYLQGKLDELHVQYQNEEDFIENGEDGDENAFFENLTFRHVTNVFSDKTLSRLIEEYKTAETSPDLVQMIELDRKSTLGSTIIARDGRYDVALFAPSEEIVSDAMVRLDPSLQLARLNGGVRALIVPGATKSQGWHQDRHTTDESTQYLTLLVALDDTQTPDNGPTEFIIPQSANVDLANMLPLANNTEYLTGIVDPNGKEFTLAEYDSGEIMEKLGNGELADYRGVRMRLGANEGVLFDGRIFHRGGATTGRRGPVVYFVFTDPRLEENL